MDYLTTLRSTKGFNESKIVTRFKWFLWAIEPRVKKGGGNCSDAQSRPVEESVGETTYHVLIWGVYEGVYTCFLTLQQHQFILTSSAGKAEKQVRAWGFSDYQMSWWFMQCWIMLKQNLILQIKWKIQCFMCTDAEGFIPGRLKSKSYLKPNEDLK